MRFDCTFKDEEYNQKLEYRGFDPRTSRKPVKEYDCRASDLPIDLIPHHHNSGIFITLYTQLEDCNSLCSGPPHSKLPTADPAAKQRPGKEERAKKERHSHRNTNGGKAGGGGGPEERRRASRARRATMARTCVVAR